jgi:hypothetical protein
MLIEVEMFINVNFHYNDHKYKFAHRQEVDHKWNPPKTPSNKSDNKHVKNKKFKTKSVETFTKKQIVGNNVEEHNYNGS